MGKKTSATRFPIINFKELSMFLTLLLPVALRRKAVVPLELVIEILRGSESDPLRDIPGVRVLADQ